MIRKALIVCLLVLLAGTIDAQSFVDLQRSFPRVGNAIRSKEDLLKKEFQEKGLQWPLKQMYIRSFKWDSQLEVWVRGSAQEPFKLFKTYKVCAMAGKLGPKRMEGDYQVPEGFYYINEFNPRSMYHLSLGIYYPNSSDKLLSDSLKPGGEIYIHGRCFTVGCIPLQDQQIEELYILASNAKASGQDFIPVHIFPVRYSNSKSVEQLRKASIENRDLIHFNNQLQLVYKYFEEKNKLPVVSVNSRGDYVIL